MAAKKRKWIRGGYGVVLSALTLLVGCLFIKQVWGIFRSGDSPFTRASIGAAFWEISVWVWIWLGAVVLGEILAIALPIEEKPAKYSDVAMTLKRLKGRLPDDGATVKGIKGWEIFRKTVWGVCIALGVMVAGMCLYYLFKKNYFAMFDSTFFTEHSATADRLVRILPWIISMFFIWVAAYLYHSFTLDEETIRIKNAVAQKAKEDKALKESGKTQEDVKRETRMEIVSKTISKYAAKGKTADINKYVDKALEKQKRKDEKYRLACEKAAAKRAVEKARIEKKKAAAEKHAKRNKVLLWAVRGALLGIGIFCVIQGIMGGGMTAVLEKAINICTQCIGLG